MVRLNLVLEVIGCHILWRQEPRAKSGDFLFSIKLMRMTLPSPFGSGSMCNLQLATLPTAPQHEPMNGAQD